MVFVELRAHKKLLLEVQTIKESVLRETVKDQEDENLPKGSLFTLCVGLALMFEQLSRRHAIA